MIAVYWFSVGIPLGAGIGVGIVSFVALAYKVAMWWVERRDRKTIGQ